MQLPTQTLLFYLSLGTFLCTTWCFKPADGIEREFGIEIEFVYNGSESAGLKWIADDLSRISGLQIMPAKHRDHSDDMWVIARDMSLSCVPAQDQCITFEIISPVLSLEEIDQVERVVEALQQIGATTRGKSGEYNPFLDLHVHVDVSDLTEGELRRVAANYLIFEEGIELIAPVVRRGAGEFNFFQESNRYQSHFDSLGDSEAANKVLKDHDWRSMLNSKDLNWFGSTLNALIERNLMSSANKYYYPDARRTQLNFAKLVSQNKHVLEFRLHEATTDVQEVKNWIIFAILFVESCFEEIHSQVFSLSNPIDKFHLLVGDIFNDDALLSYYDRGLGKDYPFCYRTRTDVSEQCEKRAESFKEYLPRIEYLRKVTPFKGGGGGGGAGTSSVEDECKDDCPGSGRDFDDCAKKCRDKQNMIIGLVVGLVLGVPLLCCIFYYCRPNDGGGGGVRINRQRYRDKHLRDKSFTGCNFDDCRLDPRCTLKTCTFDDCRFENHCTLDDCTGSNARFGDSTLTECKIDDARFDKCKITRGTFSNVRFKKTEATGTSFTDVSFVESTLVNCRITDARFENCSLEACHLSDANLDEKTKLKNCVVADDGKETEKDAKGKKLEEETPRVAIVPVLTKSNSGYSPPPFESEEMELTHVGEVGLEPPSYEGTEKGLDNKHL